MSDLGRETPVFTWDPRARSWLRERGPEDGAPPGPPLDEGAVATYFLDSNTGRWTASILGPQGRRVSAELKGAYRSPYAIGIKSIDDVAAPRPKEPRSLVGLVVGHGRPPQRQDVGQREGGYRSRHCLLYTSPSPRD